MLNKHSLRLAAVVCAVALAGLAISPKPACAGHAAWIPYVMINDGTAESNWWGDVYFFFHKIDNQSVDNVVWNDAVPGPVYFTGPRAKSYYDHRWADIADFDLAIHNPTDVDYTGLDPFTLLLLQVYNADDGSVVDESPEILNEDPDPDYLSWVPAWNVYVISVPSQCTRVIRHDDIFENPPLAGHFVFKIWSLISTGREGYFTARYRELAPCRYRTDSGDDDFSSAWFPYHLTYGSPALSEDLLDGITSPRLVLPYWKDTRDGITLDPGEQWSTGVHIINTETDEVCDITVTVYELDGTEIKSATFDDVNYRERIVFIPSQFLDSGDPQEGYLEAISVLDSDGETRTKILGFANATNFTKAIGGAYGGYYQCNHIEHFAIEDDG